ncbi:MAG: bifunctional diguanylate cyclase/phosphodiesterase, partial [Kineosporiaceae bacterium]
MPSLLGPGMRLMRRLGIASKLIVVILLLLIPLVASLGAGWRADSGDLATLDRERSGVAVVLPLVRVAAQLEDLDGDTGRGTAAVRAAVADVDLALAEHPDPALYPVPERWPSLRTRLRDLISGQDAMAADGGAAAVRSHAYVLATQVEELVAEATRASGLALDQSLGSHDAATVLSQQLPAVLFAVHRCRADVPTGSGTATTGELWACRRFLGTAVAELHDGLQGARASMPSDTTPDLWPAEQSLTSSVRSFADGLPDPDAETTRQVAATGSALALALAEALDEQILDRRSELAFRRLQPLLLALIALLGGAYLVLALFRATTQDVRTVLADISTVTTGALHQTPPLPGRDEFAQMSRAVIVARDRLTDLLGTLRMRATHDDLTGLGNRTLVTEKLEEILAEGTHPLTVLLVDLSRFSDVNDGFGHDTGDRLLRTVGARFHQAVGRRARVARLGADEFAVLATGASTSRDVQEIVARLQVALNDPIDIDGRRLHTAAAFGAVLHHPAEEPANADDLLRRAAVALSVAKSVPQSGLTLYEPWMQQVTRERTELAADLVSAWENGQFTVLYQPIVDLADNTLCGVEALLRWVHPQRGPIPPDVFVPLAETSGLIVPLGRWVLEEAMQQLARWQADFPRDRPLTLEVNLSADQLADVSLPGRLLSLLDRTKVAPGQLVLEITETALVRDLGLARHRLGQLSATGVRLALDDFGTGYSSLSYLRDLPVTVLKVDKSFVTGIERGDGDEAALLRSIIALGTALNLQVIAEGVENQAQLDTLRSFGCPTGQGYLWSRPRPAEAVADLLARGGDLSEEIRTAPAREG